MRVVVVVVVVEAEVAAATGVALRAIGFGVQRNRGSYRLVAYFTYVCARAAGSWSLVLMVVLVRRRRYDLGRVPV
jgi:hypothetical protein